MSVIKDLDSFVSKLLEEKGLADVDKAVYKELHSDLMSRLEDIINATIVEKLPPSKLEEFEKLLDNGANSNQFQEFIKKHIPNIDAVLGTALITFRERYLGVNRAN
jgi:hypothetical protein